MPFRISSAGRWDVRFRARLRARPVRGFPPRSLTLDGVAFNIVVAYVLVLRVGTFDLRDTGDAAAFGVGFLLIGTLSARLFGPFHGGDMNGRSKEQGA